MKNKIVPMMPMKISAEEKAAGIVAKVFYDDSQEIFICDVKTESCKPDMSYQRPLDMGHAKEYASRNNSMKVLPYPIVSLREGQLNTVDGQHRIESYKTQDEPWEVCRVIVKYNLTKAQEAELYNNLNDGKRPNQWLCYKARMSYDNDAKQQYEIAKKYGFTLGVNGSSADLINTTPIREAYVSGYYEDWLRLLSAFKNEEGRLPMKARVAACELQRGVLDIAKKFIVDEEIIGALSGFGINSLTNSANNEAMSLHASRTLRGHYVTVLRRILDLADVKPVLRMRKAA